MDPELQLKLAIEFGVRPVVDTVPFIKGGGGWHCDTGIQEILTKISTLQLHQVYVMNRKQSVHT